MHLGKRPRPQRGNSFMRRTTSMASLDPEEKDFQPQEPQNPRKAAVVQVPAGVVFRPWMTVNFPSILVSEPTHFLQVCFRCKDSLRPGRDIYMYRGDAAFCSSECRNEQIYLDERLAKCVAAARQKRTPANTAGSSTPRQRQQNAAESNQKTLALI